MPELKKTILEQKVLKSIRANSLLTAGQKILVAVSGGADSVCLLYVLNRLREELQISLHIAHLDHQLRGAESTADAAFVKELAHSLGIPLTSRSVDVAAWRSGRHLTLEEAAREVRYNFLAAAARLEGAACVAAGHNQNDQVETILLHLIRGTGSLGLQGLRPSHQLHLQDGPLHVIRPLLEVSRPEIEDYCRNNHLSYRQDSTNQSREMLRNRVRLELLPILNEYNPDIAGALLRVSRIARHETAFLEAESARFWENLCAVRGPNIIIDKAPFLLLPAALQRHLLRRAFRQVLGTLKDIETRHIESLLDALHLPAGRRLNLPSGITFSVEYTRYIFGLDIAALIPFSVLPSQQVLTIPGESPLPGWTVQAEILPAEKYDFDPEIRENWINDGFTADFDLEQTGTSLTMRAPCPGDYFQPLGLTQTKKVARFMLDARIPHDWRPRIPLICNSSQIIWLAGWRIDDRVKVTASTRNVLRLRLINNRTIPSPGGTDRLK